MTDTKISDVIIIGGGPAGLYSCFYAGLRDLSVTLLEAQEELGGKLSFYPEKFIWDIGALDPTQGSDVKESMIKQAQVFQPDIHTNSKVVDIKKEDKLFRVIDEHQNEYLGKTILFAVGGGIVSPKKLAATIDEAAKEYVHYAFPPHRQISGGHAIVSGGGDGAVDYAIECQKFAEKVSLVYRGEKLKALEAQVKLFEEQGGVIYTNTTIESVNAVGEDTIELTCLNQEDSVTLQGHALLVQHGYDRDSEFIDSLAFEFEREDDFYLKCETPNCTNYEGIYAAGDVQAYKGKVYLLLGAFQDGANAVNLIKTYLEPESYLFGRVSSHNEKFDSLNEELLKEII